VLIWGGFVPGTYAECVPGTYAECCNDFNVLDLKWAKGTIAKDRGLSNYKHRLISDFGVDNIIFLIKIVIWMMRFLLKI
jgi:hypothetical protein